MSARSSANTRRAVSPAAPSAPPRLLDLRVTGVVPPGYISGAGRPVPTRQPQDRLGVARHVGQDVGAAPALAEGRRPTSPRPVACVDSSSVCRATAGAGGPPSLVTAAAVPPGQRRGLGLRERVGGPDEGQVGERLGVVADHPVSVRVVLLRQQAHVVDERHQAVHQVARRSCRPASGERLDQPERARQERVLDPGSPSTPVLGAVPQQQPVAHEVLLDGGDGAEHLRVVRRQEPADRDQQQRGVDLVVS